MNSRQQKILLEVLGASSPVTLSHLSDQLQVSTRTIQRELKGVERELKKHKLQLSSRPGAGLVIEGDPQYIADFTQYVSQVESSMIYTPEERQNTIAYRLLTSRESIKHYAFSRELGVAEMTVAHDISALEPWLEKRGLRLTRKPGIGVFIEGEESRIRRAILDLVYKQMPQEKLLHLLSTYRFSQDKRASAKDLLAHPFIRFIRPEQLFVIENAFKKAQSKMDLQLSDNAYIGFILHIALSIYRISLGAVIGKDVPGEVKSTEEYSRARMMAKNLEDFLGITIPQSEIGQMAIRLIGISRRPDEVPTWAYPGLEEDVLRLVRIVEQELSVNLENDITLIEQLTLHFNSALHRLFLDMEIRNPLLSHVQSQYPQIYAAAEKACEFLGDKLHPRLPAEEIGYIAMHFGAAVLRKKELSDRPYQVLLVCASGMGTSRLLAVQIEKDFPEIRILGVIPLLHLKRWLEDHPPVDLVLSTVPIEYGELRAIVVHSILTERDKERISQELASIERKKIGMLRNAEEFEDKFAKINRYGEAVSELLANIYIERNDADTKEQLIREFSDMLGRRFDGIRTEVIRQELTKREALGAVWLEAERLALLHCRSETVDRMNVHVLKLDRGISWNGESQAAVRTVVVLLAPQKAPREHIELIGEISSALIDEDFVQSLACGSESDIYNQIKAVLGRGYLEKTRSVFRGDV